MMQKNQVVVNKLRSNPANKFFKKFFKSIRYFSGQPHNIPLMTRWCSERVENFFEKLLKKFDIFSPNRIIHQYVRRRAARFVRFGTPQRGQAGFRLNLKGAVSNDGKKLKRR